jgi:hypothetical protein
MVDIESAASVTSPLDPNTIHNPAEPPGFEQYNRASAQGGNWR